MTEYLILWLSVCAFIGIGMLTNMLFFRSDAMRPDTRRMSRRNRLDAVLFEPFRRK